MKTSQVNIDHALTLPGWMSERELTWLATKAESCKIIVEFGSYLGRSTRAMADNCYSGTIYAVDPWSGKYEIDSGIELMDVNTYVMPFFIENMKEHIESKKVIPVRGYSYDFSAVESADMVFIDGDHRYNTVVKDIAKALELVGINGGIVCGHDYDHPVWPGVKKAVDEIFGDSIEVEDTIWHKKF